MKSLRITLGLSLVLATGALTGCLSGEGTTGNSTDGASFRTLGGGAGSKTGGGGGVAKVTICHIPPGNPANAHSITVGSPAVPAHLAHGDYIGACGDVPPSDNPPNDNPSDDKPPKDKPHTDDPPVDNPPTNDGGTDTTVVPDPT
ncbi:MAG: putative lipoprotein [Fibrobacteres bacterium]|nr:putative lipoprotein [Fibrobacterota bacterium]